MKLQSLLIFLLFPVIFALAGCREASSGKEEKQEEVWHMIDEPIGSQLGPAEEEAFRQAAYEGNLEGVKSLLKQGLKCDAMDADGHTALMFAAFNGHSEIVISLLDAGAEIDRRDFMERTALLYGATGAFPETVKILLDRGANPNVVDSDEHFTPLMHASAEGNLEVVKVLLAYGADHSMKDVDGDDAASFATQAGHMQVVEYLTKVEK